jgi:hypothetical protein
MKTISNIIFLLLSACGCVCAQRESESGFLRIVNAISAGTGKAAFSINGRDLYAGGYAIGQSSGDYGIKSGDHVITVRKTGVETGRTNIKLGAGETITVIAYAERLPQKNLADPPQSAVRLLRLKQQDEAKGFWLSLISVCKPEETSVDLLLLEMNEKRKAFSKRLAVTKMNLGKNRGEIFVQSAERILSTLSPDSPGNHVVVLYENDQGTTEAMSFYDSKFLLTF